jgi:Protein of unknown function (DUF2905)
MMPMRMMMFQVVSGFRVRREYRCLVNPGKALLFAGLALAVIGAILWRAPRLFSWFGRLPGDINITRGNASFHFPVVTMIVISIVLSLLLNLLLRR